jgi:DNA-binding LytR/AlgR family response regulator
MSEKVRCLIVDDEPPALRILENYVEKVAFLEHIGSTTKPLEALQGIEAGEIDLVFLDIQMPELTGIQLSRIVKEKVKIIFTTAYPQFALESYSLDAVDYLLKPFDFERFYQAVLKFKSNGFVQDKTTQDDTYIFVKTDGKNNFEKVWLKDICYIESLKNYVAIHTLEKQIITYSTLKHLEESLLKEDFVKIHKSFLVSLEHIEKTDTLSVYVKEKALPIGDTHRKAFFEHIHKMKL